MLKRLVTLPFLVVASFYIFIVEEFIWDPAVALLKWARRSPLVSRAEDWVAKQKGAWAIATLFIVPGISIWPVKFSALYLLGHGHPYAGVIIFLIAKIVATALFAQMYALIGQECEKVRWFHFIAEKVRWVRNKVQSHPTYQEAHHAVVALKERIRSRKSAMKHRFVAALRYARRQK